MVSFSSVGLGLLAGDFCLFVSILCSVQCGSQAEGCRYCHKHKSDSNVTVLFVMMYILQFNSTTVTYENEVLYSRPGDDIPIYQ